MNPFNHALIVENIQKDRLFMSPYNVSPKSLYWVQVLKSSEWPEITTTKDYWVLYGTVHSTPEEGMIVWGECDTPTGDNFVERGIIKQGEQVETPWIVRVSSGIQGGADKIALFFHVHDGFNGEGNFVQQTQLWTTTGGELHTATYTDRGFVLGLVDNDDHTGYLRVWFSTNLGLYVGWHLGRQSSSGDGHVDISTSPDLINWTRFERIGNTLNMPSGGIFDAIHQYPFNYNGTRYSFIDYKDAEGDFVALMTVDDYQRPVQFIKKIFPFNDLHDVSAHIEGDTAYIMVKTSIELGEPVYQFTYDLTLI